MGMAENNTATSLLELQEGGENWKHCAKYTHRMVWAERILSRSSSPTQMPDV